MTNKIPATITYDERRRPSQRFILTTPDFVWGYEADGKEKIGRIMASSSTLEGCINGAIETGTLSGLILSRDELDIPDKATDVTFRRV